MTWAPLWARRPGIASALKCIRLLKDREISLKAAAAVVEQDPVLAAGLIRLANSAAFATREPIKSVLSAATKIGASKLKTSLFEASANQLFESRDERIARAAAARCGSIRSPWQCWPRTWLRSPTPAIHRAVGIALARKWELPETVTKCVQSCDDYDGAARLSAVNAVRFANALAKREGLYLGAVDASANDALIMIGCSRPRGVLRSARGAGDRSRRGNGKKVGRRWR